MSARNVFLRTLCTLLVLAATNSGDVPSLASEKDEVDLGTTLVAIKYKDGVVVGADSRTSVSGYVSNKFAFKLNEITDRCVVCRSGSAADTQWLAGEAKDQFGLRRLRYGSVPSVSQVASFLRYRLRSSNRSLQASLICAGYDEIYDSGRIFAITPNGSMWEEQTFLVSGSGSTILMGYLDSLSLDELASYSEEEAKDLVTKLIKLSIGRDGSSGGLVRIMTVNASGIEETTIYPQSEDDTSTAKVPAKDTFVLPGFANRAHISGKNFGKHQ